MTMTLIDKNDNEPNAEWKDPREAWLRRNPPHPGDHIRYEWIVDGMTVGEAAAKLGAAYAFAGSERQSRHFAGNGPEIGRRGVVGRRKLAAAAKQVRLGSSAQAPQRDRAGAAVWPSRAARITFRRRAARLWLFLAARR